MPKTSESSSPCSQEMRMEQVAGGGACRRSDGGPRLRAAEDARAERCREMLQALQAELVQEAPAVMGLARVV